MGAGMFCCVLGLHDRVGGTINGDALFTDD